MGPNTPKNPKEAQEEFPGYPLYSPDEDIEKQGQRVPGNLDDDMLDASRNRPKNNENTSIDDEAGITAENLPEPSEYDVTMEDLQALGPPDLSMDMGEDEELKQRSRPIDFVGDDLDVPGAELDDTQEDIGSEDEENNLYSLGGDEQEKTHETHE